MLEHNTSERVTMLKQRCKRCVCKYCGSDLHLRRIIFTNFEDTRIEIFCKECNRIEFGVEPEIYISAKYFVEETGFNCFCDLDDNEYTKQMTIAKVCEIITWHDQNLGFLDKQGFNVKLNMNKNFLGDCVVLTERDLDFDVNEIIDFDALNGGE